MKRIYATLDFCIDPTHSPNPLHPTRHKNPSRKQRMKKNPPSKPPLKKNLLGRRMTRKRWIIGMEPTNTQELLSKKHKTNIKIAPNGSTEEKIVLN